MDGFDPAKSFGPDVAQRYANRYDPVTQILDENHVYLTKDGVRLFPISCRLVRPSEMDLMARIAGLRLAGRWGGWRDQPFTASSSRHISVHARAAE